MSELPRRLTSNTYLLWETPVQRVVVDFEAMTIDCSSCMSTKIDSDGWSTDTHSLRCMDGKWQRYITDAQVEAAVAQQQATIATLGDHPSVRELVSAARAELPRIRAERGWTDFQTRPQTLIHSAYEDFAR